MIVSLNELNLQRSGAVFFGVVDCDRKNDGKENNKMWITILLFLLGA